MSQVYFKEWLDVYLDNRCFIAGLFPLALPHPRLISGFIHLYTPACGDSLGVSLFISDFA